MKSKFIHLFIHSFQRALNCIPAYVPKLGPLHLLINILCPSFLYQTTYQLISLKYSRSYLLFLTCSSTFFLQCFFFFLFSLNKPCTCFKTQYKNHSLCDASSPLPNSDLYSSFVFLEALCPISVIILSIVNMYFLTSLLDPCTNLVYILILFLYI